MLNWKGLIVDPERLMAWEGWGHRELWRGHPELGRGHPELWRGHPELIGLVAPF
jgi:hypothetical protein